MAPTLDSPQSTSSVEPRSPQGVTQEQTLEISGRRLAYQVEANWLQMRDKDEKPLAEIFYTAYTLRDSAPGKRPLTFVFNGGPGAASAYLHLGALGPRRILFRDQGEVPTGPTQLVDNEESWLPFTDLVFIDPVGTGLSRKFPDAPQSSETAAESKSSSQSKDFFATNRDLESLGEFIQLYLTRQRRWSSPVYVAGESYGGFRAAKLSRRLQTQFGIGLRGAILISPALEWPLLSTSDYDVLPWANLFPSYVAVSHHHERCRQAAKGESFEKLLPRAEQFADQVLAPWLMQGMAIPEKQQKEIVDQLVQWLGLEPDMLRECEGRIPFTRFARLLLRSQRKVCGYYDGTLTAEDPFPDRELYEGADPTLQGVDRIFSTGINMHLRDTLGLTLERPYTLLNYEVNTAWKHDDKNRHVFDIQMGGTDDLRYALSLNPHMKVLISHGYHDLVTPYFASNRLVRQMKLTPSARERLLVRHFEGGHMFYTWKKSLRAFRDTVQNFYTEEL